MEELRNTLILANVILEKTDKLNPRYKYILMNNPELLYMLAEATCFLKYDAPMKARIQCVIQDITEQPLCKLCKAPCTMTLNGSRYNNNFSTYCGRRCGGLDTKNIISASDRKA